MVGEKKKKKSVDALRPHHCDEQHYIGDSFTQFLLSMAYGNNCEGNLFKRWMVKDSHNMVHIARNPIAIGN